MHIGQHLKSFKKNILFISGHPRAQKYTLDQAKALAMTGIELLLDKQLMAKVRKDFEEGMKRENAN